MKSAIAMSISVLGCLLDHHSNTASHFSCKLLRALSTILATVSNKAPPEKPKTKSTFKMQFFATILTLAFATRILAAPTLTAPTSDLGKRDNICQCNFTCKKPLRAHKKYEEFDEDSDVE
jgi:hypothetical protein